LAATGRAALGATVEVDHRGVILGYGKQDGTSDAIEGGTCEVGSSLPRHDGLDATGQGCGAHEGSGGSVAAAQYTP